MNLKTKIGLMQTIAIDFSGVCQSVSIYVGVLVR